MRRLLAVTKREIASYFVSPLGYVLLAALLLLCSYFFFNLLGSFNYKLTRFMEMPVQLASKRPNVNGWVVEPYYQVALFLWIFFVPFLTMKSFAEERRGHTLELLFTSPISTASLLLGKFLAYVLLLLIFSLCISLYPFLLWFYGEPEGMLLISGLAAVFLTGVSFLSVGIAFSILCAHQVVAGIVCFVFLLLLYFVHSLSDAFTGVFSNAIRFVSPVLQANEYIVGVVSLQGGIYYLSFILFGLSLSYVLLCSQRRS